MAASGEMVLVGVAPIQVMDPRHVCSDIARGSGGFLERRKEEMIQVCCAIRHG